MTQPEENCDGGQLLDSSVGEALEALKPLVRRSSIRLKNKNRCHSCDNWAFLCKADSLWLCKTCWNLNQIQKPWDSHPQCGLPITETPNPKRKRSVRKNPIVGVPKATLVLGGSPDTAMEIGSSDDEDVDKSSSETKGLDNEMGETPEQGGIRRSTRYSLRDTTKRRLLNNAFVYPSRQDIDQVEVSGTDLQCLDPFEYLNDTIIYFYIKYIQNSLEEGRRARFFFCNSFFYKRLSFVFMKRKDESKNKMGSLSKLRKWTRGDNIFQKSYMIIPIHDRHHWSLAIICFPPRDERVGPKKLVASVLHLDSLKVSGHSSPHIFRVLRSYLAAELEHEVKQSPNKLATSLGCRVNFASRVPVRRVQVPLQLNEFDCGCYLLHYLQLFCKTAPESFCLGDDCSPNMFGRDWFPSEEPSRLREEIRDLVEMMLNDGGPKAFSVSSNFHGEETVSLSSHPETPKVTSIFEGQPENKAMVDDGGPKSFSSSLHFPETISLSSPKTP